MGTDENHVNIVVLMSIYKVTSLSRNMNNYRRILTQNLILNNSSGWRLEKKTQIKYANKQREAVIPNVIECIFIFQLDFDVLQDFSLEGEIVTVSEPLYLE